MRDENPNPHLWQEWARELVGSRDFEIAGEKYISDSSRASPKVGSITCFHYYEYDKKANKDQQNDYSMWIVCHGPRYDKSHWESMPEMAKMPVD